MDASAVGCRRTGSGMMTMRKKRTWMGRERREKPSPVSSTRSHLDLQVCCYEGSVEAMFCQNYLLKVFSS